MGWYMKTLKLINHDGEVRTEKTWVVWSSREHLSLWNFPLGVVYLVLLSSSLGLSAKILSGPQFQAHLNLSKVRLDNISQACCADTALFKH